MVVKEMQLLTFLLEEKPQGCTPYLHGRYLVLGCGQGLSRVARVESI